MAPIQPTNMKKKRRSIFDKDYAPYGTYDTSQGFGNPDDWANAFKQRFSKDEIKTILGDNDPWSVLGLTPGATQTDIKKAFFRLAKLTHPDHNPDKDGSEFRKVKAAYDELTT